MKRETPKRPDEIIKQRGRTSLALGVILFSLFIRLQQDTVSNSFPECTPDSITLLIIITNLLIFENRWQEIGTQRWKERENKEVIDLIYLPREPEMIILSLYRYFDV